jgi:hypothetical protein
MTTSPSSPPASSAEGRPCHAGREGRDLRQAARAPRRAWRAQGDLYIYTDEAHELLTGPAPGVEDTPLTTAELEHMIAREAQRVRRDLALVDGALAAAKDAGDVDLETVELANALLPDEFRAWQEAGHRRARGAHRRTRPPRRRGRQLRRRDRAPHPRRRRPAAPPTARPPRPTAR